MGKLPSKKATETETQPSHVTDMNLLKKDPYKNLRTISKRYSEGTEVPLKAILRLVSAIAQAAKETDYNVDVAPAISALCAQAEEKLEELEEEEEETEEKEDEGKIVSSDEGEENDDEDEIKPGGTD